jgi:hypothetical protein
MKIIERINQKNYKTISIIGLAKNAGKTMTLNYLLQSATISNMKIGITTMGRDGESIDLVTGTQKPSILATEGMVVATAKKTLLLSPAKVEILETTGINTPMGEVVIVRIKQRGNIQIAGPVNMTDMKFVCGLLEQYGVDVVFIDGAVDRKASSSPLIADACIIATGAALSRDMKKVIEKTAHIVECYTLKTVEPRVKKQITGNKTCVIQNSQLALYLDITTNINSGKKICEQIDENSTHVFIKGAITHTLLKDISQSLFFRDITIVVEDGTKVFVEPSAWNELKSKGLHVESLNSIDVVALTLNPSSPEGYFFDSDQFKSMMEGYLPDIKIIDVLSGGEDN